MSSVRALLRHRRAEFAGAVVLLVGHELGEAGVPVILGLAIDDAIVGGNLGHLVFWLLALAVDFLVLSLTYRFGSRIAAQVRFGVAHDLRVAVVARVLDGRGIAGERAAGGGETLTVAVSDARRVGDAVRTVAGAVADLTVLLAALVAVAIVSPLLAAVVIPGGIVTVVVIAALGRPVEARSHLEQEANARAASMTVDLVAGLRVLAGLRAGAAAATRYRGVSGRAVGAAIRSAEAEAAVEGIAALAVGIYLTAVAAVSAELALDGHISIAAVIAVLGLSQMLLEPLQGIGQAVPAARRGRASAERIAALLDAPTVLAGTDESPLPVAGDLTIESLVARGLEGLNLTVRAGTLHGIATESPASAESLVRALAGEGELPDGRIRLGEEDLAAAAPGTRRDAILSWLHHSVPPGDTIAEIVAADRASELRGLYDPERSGAGAGAAVEAAGAAEILERIPGGWDAPVAERGGSLSGGERQRLALARVLGEQPPVLVMHEPTSAVDAVTELAIAAGIARSRRGLTTLLVTTSPTLLAACDEVSLLVDGRVVDSAPHPDLLESDQYREVLGR